MNNTLNKARAFIYRNARPLDLARWQYHFENGSKEAVLTALAAYQNEDGGFGHALEPDAWNPNSSPMQTWTATEILREINYTDSTHPIFQGILRYLESGKDFEGRVWYNSGEGNNDYPHAPWWHIEGNSPNYNNYSTTASLAGFIIRFADKGSEIYKLGCRIAKEAYDVYFSQDLLDDTMTASCYVRLMQYCDEAEPYEIFDLSALKERLCAQVKHSITKNTAEWETSYICKPSQFFNNIDSIFYADNKEIANYECDFILKTQLEDGSWNITWGWNNYPEEWAVSKNWWKSNGAISNMLYLKGMGKLDAYNVCPILETSNFLLRPVRENDSADLLVCYSDQKSQIIFDFENCTSNFCYSTVDEMKSCIRFWLDSYAERCFIRLSIIDKQINRAIGTIEMFSNSNFLPEGAGGVLRIDLASKYETVECLNELLELTNKRFYDMFDAEVIVTKGKPIAQTRRKALLDAGYTPYNWKSTNREHYYIRRKT